jgi:alpha-tubulin suppressor-like RCC1 family protein
MAIIKCKMCGGDVELAADKTFGTCEYCGSTMTFPKVDDEQRAAAFNRGNHFRRIGEFDKALAVYERIVRENDTDAEAHWCCALCRFGIEYVEDPATYEYLPTCHRASFDSFLEDVDYLAAVEHSEGITKRQYQKDAAKIAEVQRGILATSQNEDPFDVFICYKESDENGDRTRDSLMAQDVYYQLTDQGYRVFFARITLEDVVGKQYEPYIFAALNSAKVMITIGTKPEYMNAVWVKNEWSRFLAMMKKDRHKILLPCYKDMDPYDMPEQLSVLQSYDMSKIGFIQDLTRGIAKVLNAEKKPDVVQETVVVQPVSPTGTAPLLQRAFMFLEDGDWNAADEYCEKVLDMEPQTAWAYVGKALAEEECTDLDALVKKRLEFCEQVQEERKVAQMDSSLATAAVETYAIPGYYTPESILKHYEEFDRSYLSTVSSRQVQLQQEDNWWKNHRHLRKALSFAEGDVKQQLDAAWQTLYDGLLERIQGAQIAEEKQYAVLCSRYAALEEVVRRNFEEAKIRRHNAYESCTENVENLQDISVLESRIEILTRMNGYAESVSWIERCKKQIDQIKAEISILEEEKNRKQKRRKKVQRVWIGALIAVVPILVIVVFWGMSSVLFSSISVSQYKRAVEFQQNGDYEQAYVLFQKLEDSYKDSGARKEELARLLYDKAQTYAENGETGRAAIAFNVLGDYQDAKQHSKDLWEQSTTREVISAGRMHTVALKADGTVIATGSSEYGMCDVSGWSNIMAISAGGYHTVGLKTDGTVIAVGRNKYGECRVSDWTNIVAISAGDTHTIGLKADGTVVATGDNDDGQCDVSAWTDIVAISAGGSHTVGLRADGTVLAVGDNTFDQCEISKWSGVAVIDAGIFHTIGLKKDGSVIVATDTKTSLYSGEGVGTTNKTAISGGHRRTICLRENGTVTAEGNNAGGACNVICWEDIVAISAGWSHTVGLKSDGTVIAVGSNSYSQCDVSEWSGIKLP